ncbi:MAG: CapA family protein [Patescibacteria group bacterium]|mgnify:FL=1
MKTKFQIASYILTISLAVGVGLMSAFWLEKVTNVAGSRLSFLADVALVSKSYFVATSTDFSSVPTTTSRTTNETSLVFVGDIMLDRGVKNSIAKNGAGDYRYIIDDISKIQTADILVGNLEGPASDQGENKNSNYSFRMSPEALVLLKDSSFNVLTVANNHIGDWGRPAFLDTLARIKDLGMIAVGGGSNFVEASTPQIIDKNGTRFGFLAFTDVGPAWLAANDKSSGLVMAGDKRMPQIIKDSAGQVDVLIVSYHFGTEYQKVPNVRQKQLAHLAIDNGAKIVVGTHPHVPEEMENYNGGLIFYSLGNFIFDQNFSPDTMSGLVVKINFQGKNILDVWKMHSVQDKQFRVRVE